MNKTGIVIILLCFLAAVAVVLWERRKARKTMEEIERMLDAAMTGSFSETTFDESRLSALETKFAHYLSAAEASSQNIAQEKDKIKTLIADIFHQTKTPIANLLLYSELLMEETLPASAKANVEALYKQAEKLRFLIDSLVKLSRLENGIISLAPQQAALQPLLENVVEQYTAKASEKGLSLQMQDTDAFAVFDFKWTAEALANIVDNAIKYTEHGTITISAVSYEMFARIDISDTGSGISESEQAKIFARFYRSNSVQKGEFVAIVGTSGSGKSTLLHMLGGLDRPTSGTVMVDGQDIFSLKEEALTIFRRRKIGFVFQAYNLVPVLNVYENIVLPIELDGGKVNKDFVQQIVQTLGLDDRLDALPNQLSGGQQQRVAIARALAAAPAIILADEPTGNLDSKTSQDVLSLLKVSSQKFAQTIVMITHNEEIAQMADRIIRIEDGRIVSQN